MILDIVMAGYMAPGASVIVYEGYYPNDVLNRMATDNLARQLSCSWGYGINSTTEQIFKQMIAQGQSFFTASGDSGAYSGGIMPPADDPNVTSVGGTALTTSGSGRDMDIRKRVERKRRRRQHHLPDSQLSAEREYGGTRRLEHHAQHARRRFDGRGADVPDLQQRAADCGGRNQRGDAFVGCLHRVGEPTGGGEFEARDRVHESDALRHWE